MPGFLGYVGCRTDIPVGVADSSSETLELMRVTKPWAGGGESEDTLEVELTMPIAEVIAATTGAFEVGKIALDLLRHPNIDVSAVQGRLLELQGLILSAQSALGDAEDENRKLRADVDRLNDQLKVATTVIHGSNAYWTRQTTGKLDGPFCTVCLG